MLLTKEPGRACVDDASWPPATTGPPYKLHPVAGLTLPPHTFATLICAARLDAPRTHIGGPITRHGVTALIPGIGMDGVSVSGTRRQYGALGSSGQGDCDRARQSSPV